MSTDEIGDKKHHKDVVYTDDENLLIDTFLDDESLRKSKEFSFDIENETVKGNDVSTKNAMLESFALTSISGEAIWSAGVEEQDLQFGNVDKTLGDLLEKNTEQSSSDNTIYDNQDKVVQDGLLYTSGDGGIEFKTAFSIAGLKLDLSAPEIFTEDNEITYPQYGDRIDNTSFAEDFTLLEQYINLINETEDSDIIEAVLAEDNDGIDLDQFSNEQEEEQNIEVVDSNDNAQVFTSGDSATVSESANGSTVFYTATTTDADTTGETITYSLTDNAGGLFEINSSTGEVTLASGQSLDYETATSHNITIQSSDGTNTTDHNVTINVTDIAENIVLADGGVTFADTGVTETSITGGTGNDIITGSSGDDTITGRTGDDTIDGGAGTDTLVMSSNAEYYEFWDNNDGSWSIWDNNSPWGSPSISGDDLDTFSNIEKIQFADKTFTLTDFVEGTSGADTLNGTADDDWIMAYDGNDTITGAGGSDHLQGGLGNDNLNGGDGNDALLGSEGNDILTGGDGADHLNGGADNDTLTGGAGNDTIGGGGGTDTAIYSGNWSDYTITENSGTYTIVDNRGSSPDGTDTVIGVENFQFADGTVAVADLFNVGPTDIGVSGGSVNENSGIGTVVATLSTTDANALDSHTYSITSDPSGFFQIVDNEVRVKAGASLDYETATSHNITIEVTDSHGSTYSKGLTVNVTDTNDVGQVFTSGATGSGAENINDTTVVYTAATTDADTTGETITYSLTDNAGGLFEINSSTGEVTLASGQSLDYETATSHNITIQSSDGTNTTDHNVTINVTDVNDTSQVFTSGATGSGAENINDTTAVYTAATTDADTTGESITYSLTDNAGGLFEINSSTGEVTLVSGQSLDYESATSHNITIKSSDGTNTTDQNVTINVTDENDVAQVFTSGATGSGAENINDTTVVYTAATTDADTTGETITYSLTDNAGGLFEINSSTGEVTLASGQSLDYETATSHNITIQSSDGTNTTDHNVTINVTDTNDVGQVFTSGATGSGAENINDTTVVYTAATTDADTTGESITYSLTDNAGGLFEIDSSTGEVTLASGQSLDYETATSHNITIQSSDGTNTTDHNVTINVTDTNDVGQVFTSGATGSGAENINDTTVVYTAATTDADTTGESITYSLTDNAGGLFEIDSSTGEVTLASGQSLDYETATSHNITIQSSDGTNTTNHNVTINVTDTNDVGQVFTSGATGSGVENINDTTVVYTAATTDADTTGESITYSLTNNAGGLFEINSSTGEVTLASGQSLDYETATSHNITIQSSDGTNTTDHNVTINVTDTNDVGQVFTSGATGSGAENINDTTVVYTATTTDADTTGESITYGLTDNAGGLFEINSSTGEVTLASGQSLDYETATSHNITIQSSDGTNTTDHNVTINVTDVAENVQLANGGVIFTDTSVTETSITGGTGNDTITGTSDIDVINGGAGADTIYGGDGSDDIYISDGFGSDVIDGGAGTQDDLKFENLSTGITVTGTGDRAGTATDGIDTLSFSDIEDLDGSNYADTIDMSVDTYGMYMDGYDGDDILTGGSGNDDIEGDAGNDTLTGGAGNDTIDGGVGNDTLYGGTGADTLTGGDGDDIIQGGSGHDTIYGGAGNDTINTGDGNDTVDAGTGIDTLSAINGYTNTIDIDAGTYTRSDGSSNTVLNFENVDLTGSTGTNSVVGNDSDNVLTGGSGADTLIGGDGNDTIKLGDGNDYADAGTGIDTLSAINGYANTIDIDAGTYTRSDGSSNTVLNFENVDLTGSTGTNSVVGNDSGNVLTGGSGADRFTGGAGNDTIDGGTGTDTAVFSGNIQDYSFEINDDGQLVVTDQNINDGDDGTDTLSGIETVQFNGTSYSLSNLVDGSDGYEGGGSTDDFVVAPASGGGTIWGDTGNDVLAGGAGNDILDGDDGEDILIGGAGNDSLWASDGADEMYGGSGDDKFTVENTYAYGDIIDGGEGTDTLQNRNGSATPNASKDIRLDADTQINSIEVIDGAPGDGASMGIEMNVRLDGAGTFDLSSVTTLTDVDQIIGDTDAQNIDLSGLTSDADIDLGSGDDTVISGSGNDTITGGAGNDTIDGGSGTDTVTYAGNRSDYTITENSGVYTVLDNRTGSPEGTDTVNNIENFQFADGTIGIANISDNQAPTDITITSGSPTMTTSAPGTAVVTGEIVNSTFDSSIDHWEITHNGGDLTIDVLAWSYNSGYLDSKIILYRDNGDQSYTLISENDDGAAGSDGSFGFLDSYISETGLASGTYILAIGNRDMSSAEALETESDYPNDWSSDGPYQITISGDATVSFAMDPDDGATKWGDPQNNAVVVDGTGGAGGDVIAASTVVATASGVDPDAGETFSYSLTDDAGGKFSIDSDGDISLVAEHDASSSFSDTVTVRTTDSGSLTYDEVIGIELGTNSDDTLSGSSNSDVVYGFDGVDTFHGSAGADVIDGGSGIDIVNYSNSSSAVTVNLTTGNNTGGDAEGDILTAIEYIIGSAHADNLTGDAGDNQIKGGIGNDFLVGSDGNDTFFFSEGHGTDTIDGGSGGSWTDSVYLFDSSGGSNLGTYGTDWTVSLTEGSISSQTSNQITLTQDADGTITLQDGSQVNFTDIEEINY